MRLTWLYRVAIAVASLASAAEQAPPESLLYVSGSDGVSVIDVATDTEVATYPIGPSSAMAVTANGRHLYVGSAEPPFQVALLDTSNGQVVRTLSVPGAVSFLALTPPEDRLWVSHVRHCQDTGECVGAFGTTVFDTSSYSVRLAGEVPFGRTVFDAAGATAYVASANGVLALDAATLSPIATRPAICCVSSGVVAMHPNGHTVYVLGNEFGGFVAVADLTRPLDYAPAFFVMGQSEAELNFQHDIAFSPDGSRAYLPGRAGRTEALFILDTSDPWAPTLETVLALERATLGIALTRDGARAYLANFDSSLTAVDLSTTQVTTIPLRSRPWSLVAASSLSPPPEDTYSPTQTPTAAPTRTPTFPTATATPTHSPSATPSAPQPTLTPTVISPSESGSGCQVNGAGQGTTSCLLVTFAVMGILVLVSRQPRSSRRAIPSGSEHPASAGAKHADHPGRPITRAESS